MQPKVFTAYFLNCLRAKRARNSSRPSGLAAARIYSRPAWSERYRNLVQGLWEGRAAHACPCNDTPSLNPGLWYNWYPPIAGRRQAKKTRRALTGVVGIAPRRPAIYQSLPAPRLYCTAILLDWMSPGFAGPGFEVGS